MKEENKSKTKRKVMAFAIFGFLIVGMIFATAGLVTYLSNKAEVSMAVESPMLFEVSDDGSIWVGEDEAATLNLGAFYAGESTTFFARDSNLANVDTVGDSSKIVTCDIGVTCNDFISVIAQTETKINGVSQSISQEWEIISLCNEEDANTVTFNYGAPGDPLVVGQADTTEITVTFQPNALGNYVFELQKEAQ